jgi:branched-chain amino acid transport system substrate-binding protein
VRAAVALCALAVAATQAVAQQGVTKDEILIGSIQDLSGPIAGFGKQARMGMLLRVDEINEQGGIHGRKIKLVIEDSAYDPKKAALAAEKLVNQDKIFMMVGHIGTAQNLAARPVQFEKNVINFFPLTGAREMYEPLNRLKYAFFAPYYDQMAFAVPKVAKEKGAKRACILYQDDEAGQEMLKGTETGLKTIGMELVEKTSFKRGATDFSSQVAKLQAAGCDLVALGTIIRETIGAIGTARKLGFSPTFVASNAAYTDLIHKLGGAAMNGLYAASTVQNPYLDDASQPIRFWASKYKTKFNEDPTVFSVYGYSIVDAFANAATKAGKGLNTDSFIKAMDTMTIPANIFGSPDLSFSATKRLGSDQSRLSQIQDSKWKVVSEYQGAANAAPAKAAGSVAAKK